MGTMQYANMQAITRLVRGVNTIGVIGFPGAGKTTLAERIAEGRPISHTDDFLKLYSHDDRPEVIMARLAEWSDGYVVEGNEVTRLITRGLRLDLVILVLGSTRNDKAVRGLQGRVKKFMAEHKGHVYAINPRDEELPSVDDSGRKGATDGTR